MAKYRLNGTKVTVTDGGNATVFVHMKEDGSAAFTHDRAPPAHARPADGCGHRVP
jgi:alkylation response protein AidB-like acyl-CoA dehydrogenase